MGRAEGSWGRSWGQRSVHRNEQPGQILFQQQSACKDIYISTRVSVYSKIIIILLFLDIWNATQLF